MLFSVVANLFGQLDLQATAILLYRDRLKVLVPPLLGTYWLRLEGNGMDDKLKTHLLLWAHSLHITRIYALIRTIALGLVSPTVFDRFKRFHRSVLGKQGVLEVYL